MELELIILLMVLTVLVTIGFFAVLLRFLTAITVRLESIGGGGDSSLRRTNADVGHVKGHTSFIEPQLTQLNAGLRNAAAGLDAIDQGLVAVAGAAVAQEKYR